MTAPHLGQALLVARARALAVPRADADADDAAAADLMSVLVFQIGDERMALPLAAIVAVGRAGSVTPLPHAIAPVYGVVAWRGHPLTVLTLSLPATVAADAGSHLIVLVDERHGAVGLLVQSVEETRLVARSALSPVHGGARGAIALGATDDAVLVLSADALLNAARSEP
jgi:chemotaxis signal transduction protein